MPMRAKALLIPLLFIATMFGFSPISPVAQASIPLVTSHCFATITSNQQTISCSLSSTAGDVIVVEVSWNMNQNSPCPNVNSPAVSDTSGDSFTQQVLSPCTTGTFFTGEVAIYSASASTTSGSQTVQMDFGYQPNEYEVLSAQDVSNIGLTAISTGSNDGTCNNGVSCMPATSAAISWSGGSVFGVSGLAGGQQNPTGYNAPTGTTADPPNSGGQLVSNANGVMDSALYSPSTFQWSYTASNTRFWTTAAAVFGIVSAVTAVSPCTFFELQCWWYPLFFMGLYSGFILMVGTWLRTSPRGKSHLFLSAVTFGSLVAVIFGIMNIAFPLMMLVLNTIIALRLRG